MSLTRMTPSSAQLTGGDLSVDVLHTEDSVALGDGTNLIGTFASVEGVRSLPVQVKGVAKTKITDSTETDFAEIEDVGGEKALKVSVIASVGGGGGGTAATDSAAFTATATQGTPIMGAYDDVASDALAEGEMGIIRATSGRALHVAVQNSVAVTGTFWQATQPVSGTVAVTDLATLATAANQTTIIGHLDGVEGLLGTIDADTGNMATSLALLDDAVFTDDAAFTPATSKVLAIGATFDDTATDSVDEGDIGALRMTSSRHLMVNVQNASLAVTGTFWQATQPVSGTVAISSIAAGDNNIGNVDIASIAAGDNNIGNVDVVTLPSIPAGTNNIGDVDVLTLPSLPAGTNNIGDVDVLTLPDATVVGKAAHDAAVSGNPVLLAGRATNANPTSVASGDVCYLNTDLAGRQIVSFSDRALVTRSATITITNTTETTIIAAGGAGVFHDLTTIVITNTSSTGARADIRDASGGTVQFAVWVPATGGIVIPLPVPLNQTTANSAWTVQMSASVTDIRVMFNAIKRIA